MKALCFQSDQVSVNMQDWRPTWLTTIIGEHCVARLFQRMSWSEVPKPKDVLPELRELALLPPWYAAVDHLITHQNNGATLTAFIPISHCAFLGVHNPNDSGVMELRTFIGLHQMGDRQKALWEALREAHGTNPFSTHLGDFMRPDNPRQNEVLISCHQALLNTHNTLVTYTDLLGTEVLSEDPSLALEPQLKQAH